MEGKSAESGSGEEPAPPSVAKLAGLFGDTLNSPKKEVPPPHKPTRRKPPCSLPLPKTEVTNNGDEKLSPPHSQVPKIKVKSSPLIEKLQANLAFAPAALLPGPPPKSPGLKTMASPWSTPPSTPSSPGVQSHSSNIEASPVSFEQPPEGSHLQSFTKVRTRGSIKRRPPSRKFRKSQSDMDFDVETYNAPAKENGDKSEEGDAALRDKESVDGSPVAENSPSEPAEKTSEEQNTKQEEEEEGERGEKSDKQEAKPDTNETETPDMEEKSEDPGEEQDKCDGDDKPEK
ncbi:capZ-interacting protein [Bufo gargarizans]|uniref:capZ-interacting protein n=1 Tax=Bufo gargarizans TaxID=30331 RepID=UPI001CF251A2|nr:capZ-interacting protein [Bufo gargarizans]XP_044140049.1 capZ-interacting protein [Bufo gargarizans]